MTFGEESPAPGTLLFDRYRLLRRIARGGMASVYLAQQTGGHGFSKWVAVKVIHPHLANDRHLVSMFLDEMRVASRIHHSNICTVLDFGTHEGVPCLVMEFLDGVPLSAALRRGWEDDGKVPFDLVARVIADAGRGLHAAHEQKDEEGRSLGVIHRDVSPQNLFVLFEGAVKVLDFGVARARGRIAVTRIGELKGKIAYMAPEQLRGEASIDRRVDVWALGVVLWEGTVGRRLFRVEERIDTVENVLKARIPPPSEVREGYPRLLEEAVLGALERDPAKRIASARELSQALERYLYSTQRPFGAEEVADFIGRQFADRLPSRRGEDDEPSIVSVDDLLEERDDLEPSILSTESLAGGSPDRLPIVFRTATPGEGRIDRNVEQAEDLSEEPEKPRYVGLFGTGRRSVYVAVLATMLLGVAIGLVTVIGEAREDEVSVGIAISPDGAPPAGGDVRAIPAKANDERPMVRVGAREEVVDRDDETIGRERHVADDSAHRAASDDDERQRSGLGDRARTAVKQRAAVTRSKTSKKAMEARSTAGDEVDDVATPRGDSKADGTPANDVDVPPPNSDEPPPSKGGAEDESLASAEGSSERVDDATSAGQDTTERPSQVAPGTLNLLAIPAATVFFRGRVLGRTPLVEVALPAGRQTLTVRPARGDPKTITVQIRSGETTRRTVRF